MYLNKRMKIINALFLLEIFLFQIFDNVLRELTFSNGIISKMKNILLFITILFFLLELFLLKKSKCTIVFKDELKSILLLGIIFLILSIYQMITNDGFYIVTIVQIVKIFIPIIFAYTVLNVMEFKDIYNVMVIYLVISFVTYLYSIGFSNLSIGNFMSISFLDSYSPFESNFFSPTAIGLCIFFAYYRKNKICLLVSVLFTIMTFKRIMVLFAIFLLFFGMLIKIKDKISKTLVNITKFGFCFVFYSYIQFLQGKYDELLNRIFGMGMNSLSMGRAWLMENLINNNFRSFGFYSSTVDFRGIEMDLPMIYIEMGILSVIATVFLLSNLIKENLYNYVIVVFSLFELLTSHWFDITYFWIVMYITIGCISYKSEKTEKSAG